MTIECPWCRAKIPLDDVNVATDLALCRACGRSLRYSELVQNPVQPGLDLNTPPPGAWFERNAGGFRAGATTRSWMALFLVPFTCVWAGGSMYGIYGQQFIKGEFNTVESLFGLPFLAGSIFLVLWCALTVAGKIEIVQSADRVSIFNGIGPIGITRSYLWSDFSTVREDSLAGNYTFNMNPRGQTLALEGKRRITFGSMWSSGRRYFVLQTVRAMLRESKRS